MSRKKKIKKNQIPYFWIIFIFAVFLAIYFYWQDVQLGIYWTFGILFGFVLQKSRFCFTAALRDPIIAGSTSLLRAVLFSMAVMTVFFAIIQYTALANGVSEVPGRVHAVGWHIVIGAFIFGLGMVIAGGCATGTLMRIGEGFLMQVIALLGFLIGSLWGARDFPWWEKIFIEKSPTIHLADIFGWLGAVLIQLFILAVIYYLAKKYDEKYNIML